MEIPHKSDDIEKQIIDLLYRSPNQTMLRDIAQKCGDIFGVNTCLIISGVGLRESAQIGFWHQSQIDFSLTKSFLSHSEINTVLAQEQPYVLSNDLAGILSATTILGARTEFQGTVNGLILLGKIDSKPWTPDEHNQLIIASKYVSIASALAQSQQEIRSEQEINPAITLANLNRSTLMPEMPIMRRLYDLNRQHLKQQQNLLEQQRQLNDKKNDIITAISDKARNPLATMKMAIDLLNNSERNLPPQKEENYWNILRQEWNNLNDLINSIVTLEKIESKTINFQLQLINLTTIIKNLESIFTKHWGQDQRKPLSLKIDSVDSPSHLQTDLQHLESILQELLTNAIHFSAANQTIFVKLTQVFIGLQKAVCITITNTGLGILDTEKESIYEPFYRGTGVIERGISGTGVGLAVVKGLVELLGGSIEMKCNSINNSEYYLTSFTVVLPLNPDSNNHPQC
jgi:signal transduction histidine kinase